MYWPMAAASGIARYCSSQAGAFCAALRQEAWTTSSARTITVDFRIGTSSRDTAARQTLLSGVGQSMFGQLRPGDARPDLLERNLPRRRCIVGKRREATV